MLEDTKFWVAWNLVPGIGRVRLGLLKDHFGSLGAAWGASSPELRASGHDAAPEYPERLLQIYDPPAVLYVKGTILPEDAWSITVVGTRVPTAYGREVCARLVRDLARNRITVLGGLARGIDAVAHQTSLDCGARTLAVQACGLDAVYPAVHAGLASHIAEHGAVMSDYPLGTKPRAEYFPRRNRILAGLSLGTLVIEAGEKSGALITAKFANDEGREVMAVPGSILSPQARGCNPLIQDGAKAVLDVEDILEEVNVRSAIPRQPLHPQIGLPGLMEVSGDEALVLKHLSNEPTHVDELRRSIGLSIATASSTLTVLELKGLATQVGAMNYVLASGGCN